MSDVLSSFLFLFCLSLSLSLSLLSLSLSQTLSNSLALSLSRSNSLARTLSLKLSLSNSLSQTLSSQTLSQTLSNSFFSLFYTHTLLSLSLSDSDWSCKRTKNGSAMDESEKLSLFCGATGASPAEATAYLQRASGDAQTAIILYLAEHDETGMENEAPDHHTSGPVAATASAQPTAPVTAAAQPQQPRRTGIATFSSMASDEAKPDAGQTFFSGGDRSGIAVQGPPKDANEARNAFLERAKEVGQSMDEYRQQEAEAARQRSAFAGQGFRLGETDTVPSETVGVPLAARAQPPEKKLVKITFWRGGFSVDDGENTPTLRNMTDPANQQFLNEVSSGFVPQELRSLGNNVHVELEDRHDEPFEAPKRQVRSFAGAGHRLGAPTPAMGGAQDSTTSTPAASSTAAATSAPSMRPVDESKPTTKVQIRLADNTRLVGHFNEDATIGDLRAFVDHSRPGGAPYVLMTRVPRRDLTDHNETLKQAQLLNAAVFQRPL
ncbi:uncharacterized protein MONBRDRAFT_32605 [Monosiga brevicollis MX1]|uniref:UBX domain-containing protein n=1 Tax=Monosiga brevicollis TaxID=81824 RepID=A9V0L8_MONBE|nr:uncharacterized protein MONBRDRAFT_32605 [Monosiga brevicollis MX1]EDQ89038.1 predicted protein [Monosiga brevicollis MX1]|eukprot:XP_001746143.1 hypothetical protein [Monosiga brevicollis MX1]